MNMLQKKWAKYIAGTIGAVIAGFILMVGATKIVYPAISELVGLSVAQSATVWNSVVDAAKGDGLSSGILGQSLYMWNGLTFDRARGDATNGLQVNVGVVGTGVFNIDRANITTASVNLAFGLTSKKVKIIASPSNTDDICIDYLGGTAVCPAANTAGNDRLKAGTVMILDNFSRTSVSVIAASGTQEIQVTAWN